MRMHWSQGDLRVVEEIFAALATLIDISVWGTLITCERRLGL